MFPLPIEVAAGVMRVAVTDTGDESMFHRGEAIFSTLEGHFDGHYHEGVPLRLTDGKYLPGSSTMISEGSVEGTVLQAFKETSRSSWASPENGSKITRRCLI